MVPVAELRKAAETVLPRVEGLTVGRFVKQRARPCEYAGAVCYGSHYFNPQDVADGTPELLLTRSMPRATVRWEHDRFSVWIGGYGDLRQIVKHRVRDSFPQWSLYSFAFLDHEGHVLVCPSSRSEFANAVAAASGIACVWWCEDLSRGREPDLRAV